mgnify:FL=1
MEADLSPPHCVRAAEHREYAPMHTLFRLGLRRLRRWAYVVLSTLLAISPAFAAEQLALLKSKRLPEASGIAVSQYDENRLWFINDSGNSAELIAYEFLDDNYERLRVTNVKNRDWEDIESFSLEGRPWLAIADVGDNKVQRKHVYVYLLPEPRDLEQDVEVPAKLKITYPDGARDVESLAIDSKTGSLYLLSKRDQFPQLYRVQIPNPLTAQKYEIVAEKLGVVTSIPQATTQEAMLFGKYGKYLHQPTGMAMLSSAEGDAIALMTYRGAYLAQLGEDRDWLGALNDSLCPVQTPLLSQGESIGADSQRWLYVTSEGKKAPLYRLEARCRE